MSIRGMQRRMSRHLRIVLYVITGVFVVTLPAVFVPQLRGRGGEGEGQQGWEAQVVARVDGEEVTRQEVEQQFERLTWQVLMVYASAGRSVRLEEMWPYRLGAMAEAITAELMLKQAKAEGLSVSRSEVRARAEELADQELAGLKASLSGDELEQRLGQLVSTIEGRTRDRASERRFRDAKIKQLLESSDELRRELLLAKLRHTVVGSITATEQDLLARYDRATVREIQVLLHPEERPERTEEEARKRAGELAARAKRGEDFARLARAESDDPRAQETGGLIKSVAREMMPAEWSDAVFALGPDEISDPIKLPWGYVVVKIEKLDRELPEDFESRKEQLLLGAVRQKQDGAWYDYREQLREKAQVETLDPEMLAWQALSEGKQEEAIAKLREAGGAQGLPRGLVGATIFYQLGSLLEAREEWEAAAEAYESSYDSVAGTDVEVPGGRPQTAMSTARCYERLDDVEEALEWYEVASGASDDPLVHTQLQTMYKRLGRDDLAADEQQWLDEYRKAELERQEQLEALEQEAEEGEAEGAPQPPLGEQETP